MRLLARLPLRQLLTLPYVVLVLLLAGVLGTLSYQAGRNAVDDLSGQLLVETVNRIAQAVDRHVSGSAAVLETAFPRGVHAPTSLELGAADFTALRTRLWQATSVHRDPNNYAYYGDRQGRFMGLWRHSEQEAELRLRTRGEGPRTVYSFSGIQGALQQPVVEPTVFEPRQRPWFQAAYRAPRAPSGRPFTSTSKPRSWWPPAPGAWRRRRAASRAWWPPTSRCARCTPSSANWP